MKRNGGGYAEVAVMVVRMCGLLHSSVGGAERGIVDEEGSTTLLVHDEQANGLGLIEFERMGDERPRALGHSGGVAVEIVSLEVCYLVIGHDGIAGLEVRIGFCAVDIERESVGAGFEAEFGVGQALVDPGIAGDLHGILSAVCRGALRKRGVADARFPNSGSSSVPTFETGVAQQVVSRRSRGRCGIGSGVLEQDQASEWAWVARVGRDDRGRVSRS